MLLTMSNITHDYLSIGQVVGRTIFELGGIFSAVAYV